MRPIDSKDLVSPKENLVIEGEHVRIGEQGATCLKCSELLLFTAQATDHIAFMRMCEVTQTLVVCPDCGCRMVIFPKGEVPMTHTDEALVIGPPADGFYIALSPMEKR